MVGPSLNSHTLTPKSIKFFCSYGGRILPRYPDGKLRYHGGETRVLSVDRSISFAEMSVKLGEMCGTPVCLRCQLPTEDLDALVSITSDEDLVNLIEEYDRAAAAAAAAAASAPSSLKIRAFLSAPKTTKKSSSPPSPASSSSNESTSPKSPLHPSSSAFAGGGVPPRSLTSARARCIRHASRPPVYPIIGEKAAGKLPHKYTYQCHHHRGHGNGGYVYVIHSGNHWQ